MKKREYDVMNRLEGKLFWFRLKHMLVERIIDQYVPKRKGTWLDVGCGTGGLTKLIELKTSYKVIGMDSNKWALCYASKQISWVIKGSANVLPFKASSIQVVSLFDVLYHKNIHSEKICLDEASRVLKKGGLLFITDCAYPFLLSNHDVYVEGTRRFTLGGMAKMLDEQQFDVLWSSYYFSWLLPFAVIKRLLIDKILSSHRSDVVSVPDWVNWICLWMGEMELSFLKTFGRLPFGLSIAVVARKK